jgi:hypothetical protein
LPCPVLVESAQEVSAMSPIPDPVDMQLDAVGILLTHAELLPTTLETELRLYRERLAAARGADIPSSR